MLKPLRGVYAHTYTRHISYLYMVIRSGRAYIYKTNDISIYGDFSTPYNVNKHTLTLLRRSYTASVSYWLAPMYVEYSGIDFQCSSQHVHNVNHTVQVYNALYSY